MSKINFENLLSINPHSSYIDDIKMLDWKINAYDMWFAVTPQMTFYITPKTEILPTFDLYIGIFLKKSASFDTLEEAQASATRLYIKLLENEPK